MAHPDDEVLGCGGTLSKHAEAGDTVNIVILAERGMLKQMDRAAETLVGENWHVAGRSFPDQAFETVPFTRIVEEAGAYDGDVIYTHHPGDLNLDHALVARAVLTAFRPKPGERPRRIMACEVLSSTEWTFPQVFQPSWFERLTLGQLEIKVAALKCYDTEIQDWPHPRSEGGVIYAANWRGQQCGAEYAEAFQLLRAGPF
jgi:LmbE family N-acetylglucosaminyl deacetylase